MDVSKRPAIGYDYFIENCDQLVDSESILPRYYIKKLKELNPTLHERYENNQLLKFKIVHRMKSMRSLQSINKKNILILSFALLNPTKREKLRSCLNI